MTARRVELGLRENLPQFGLLVAVNAFVGAMVGLERSTLPLIGRDDFGLASKTAVLSFIVAFGLAKAITNLGAGGLAARAGRRRLLIAGWFVALPVPVLIAVAPSWAWIVGANVLLGVNQGLAWSMTVVMKIDLVGPRRRGLALGLNEAAGYGGVALAAAATGWLASEYAARDVLVVAGAAIAVLALAVSVLFVRDTAGHVALEQSAHDRAEAPPPLRRAFPDATWRRPALRACSQAGLVNNLNDALAWGLIPLYLAAHGASVGEVGLVAGIYPAVWGAGQIWTGHWSDRVGRKPPIVAGMLLQAAALAVLAGSGGSVPLAAATAVVLGAGTALVYPTLIAAISDAVTPVARAPAVGVYRFWRDMGYVAGGLLAGAVADALGYAGAIAVVAALTALSGLWVARDLPAGLPSARCSDRMRHPRRNRPVSNRLHGPVNGPLERAALDRLLDIAGGDRAFVVEIIDEYLADSATLLAALREASGDELRRTAHSLKSTSASVGAERLAALCARIEAGGGDAALTADAEREYAAVRAALERERAVFS